MLSTKDYFYELPPELIAQDPLTDRSASRLMVLGRNDGSISHRHFTDIKEYLKPGDHLVLNNTRVIPARLYGEKEGTGAGIEVLLLKRLEADRWECLVKPGKKAREGARIIFGGGLLSAVVDEIVDEGNRIIRFEYEGIFEEILDKLGEMPLPPYITHKLPRENRERYQTVYSKIEGSAAAPTAGLHFTEALLDDIREMGVKTDFVTLHVGLGTFRPVKVDNILEHHMHSEYCEISREVADSINECRKSGGRIICVGTTSVRTLESMSEEDGTVKAGSRDTDIFIYPGYKFKAVDGLITNFHLPESTLLMLVSAFAGRDNVLKAYEEAIKERYRFFSFGDAMLLI
ncbi:MAG: tRNA preQ1(34) S-adenosylmethionine ribosyltransferase-isomerase QueA [Lachnospiraceae bacterium]|nr:tRNA preQ1(34) S-adenosylmethionine ribosyltransferase-isomerase QueA [Lachnospiraceae bacterium]